MSDLIERAKEILNWHKTGILTGDFLRTRAREIREKHENAFDFGTALQMAEEEAKRLALALLISAELPESPVQSDSPEVRPDAWMVKFYDKNGVLLDTHLDFVKPSYSRGCQMVCTPLYIMNSVPSVTVRQ